MADPENGSGGQVVKQEVRVAVRGHGILRRGVDQGDGARAAVVGVIRYGGVRDGDDVIFVDGAVWEVGDDGGARGASF